MTRRRMTHFSLLVPLAGLLLTSTRPQGALSYAHDGRHCVPVGGTFMTNLAAIDGPGVPSTTLGRVTGDLSGAVAATIKSVAEPGNGTLVFTVQHHVVTDAGDFVTAAEAQATVAPVPGAPSPLFAIVTYPVQITGGTGKFAGATGALTNIGEISVPHFATNDLTDGALILRYSGHVCFAENEP